MRRGRAGGGGAGDAGPPPAAAANPFVPASIMRHPRAVQGILDAAVAGPDDIGRNGTDESVEGLGADRVDDTLAHPLRVETDRGEALGQSDLALSLQRPWKLHGGLFAHRLRPLVGTASVLEAGDRGGVDDVPFLAVLQ